MNYKRKLLSISTPQLGDCLLSPKNPLRYRSIIIQLLTERIKTIGNWPRMITLVIKTLPILSWKVQLRQEISDSTRIQLCRSHNLDKVVVGALTKSTWIKAHWLEMLSQIWIVGRCHPPLRLRTSTGESHFPIINNLTLLFRHSKITRHYRLIMILINNSERILISNRINNRTATRKVLIWGHNRQNYLQTCPGTTIKILKQPLTETITTHSNNNFRLYKINYSST